MLTKVIVLIKFVLHYIILDFRQTVFYADQGLVEMSFKSSFQKFYILFELKEWLF